MMRDEHSTHWWWQISSFVPAREPGYIPRILLSSTLWFSGILGESGDHGSTYQGEVSVLGRLDMCRRCAARQSCFAGAPTSLWHRLLGMVCDTHICRARPAPHHAGLSP